MMTNLALMMTAQWKALLVLQLFHVCTKSIEICINNYNRMLLKLSSEIDVSSKMQLNRMITIKVDLADAMRCPV